MPKPERHLIQVRLTAAERLRIKTLALRQGLTIQRAVVVAFDAWAQQLRSGGATPPNDRTPKVPAPETFEPSLDRSWAWLTRAVQLDWTKCPEVELVGDGTNELWLLVGTDAPLSEVLGAVADGNSVPEVAQIFQLDLPQLQKVIEFSEQQPITSPGSRQTGRETAVSAP
jgi:hypothetical protein